LIGILAFERQAYSLTQLLFLIRTAHPALHAFSSPEKYFNNWHSQLNMAKSLVESETMQSQLEDAEMLDFMEEQDPPENEARGGLRTRNPDGNRWQREYVHLSSEGSIFQKTVQMVLCAHGWEKTTEATPTKEAVHHQPMTLLIFRFHLTCHDPNHRFESCRMWFRFYDDDGTENGNGKAAKPTKASPSVLAWAPFVDKERKWNKEGAQLGSTTNVGGTIGVQEHANINLNASKEWTKNFTRDYFDRGSSVPLHNDRLAKTYGVEWYFQQNHVQDYGVEPDFQVAILLKRDLDSEGKQVPFMGTFEMRVQAGTMEDFYQGVKRFFWPRRLKDKPLYFDPNRAFESHGPNKDKYKEDIEKKVNVGSEEDVNKKGDAEKGDAEKRDAEKEDADKEEKDKKEDKGKKLIDLDNLGKLAVGTALTGLSEVPGLEPLKMLF
jgi:hypothetical protein